MRRLKDIYPEFADQVDFYAVGVDPTESLDQLERYRISEGHLWAIAMPGPGMISDFRVTQQSTKVAIDGRGVITYRDGYGRGNEEKWRQVLSDLAGALAE